MLSKLKYLREQLNKNKKQLANEIGINYSTYRGWEEYNIEPSIQNLIKLADYFNVSIDYLVGRDFGNDIGFVTSKQHSAFKNFLLLNESNQDKASGYIDSLKDGQNK